MQNLTARGNNFKKITKQWLSRHAEMRAGLVYGRE
jgi:hypothetical protein